VHERAQPPYGRTRPDREQIWNGTGTVLERNEQSRGILFLPRPPTSLPPCDFLRSPVPLPGLRNCNSPRSASIHLSALLPARQCQTANGRNPCTPPTRSRPAASGPLIPSPAASTTRPSWAFRMPSRSRCRLWTTPTKIVARSKVSSPFGYSLTNASPDSRRRRLRRPCPHRKLSAFRTV
jgi:hypothetical protein